MFQTYGEITRITCKINWFPFKYCFLVFYVTVYDNPRGMNSSPITEISIIHDPHHKTCKSGVTKNELGLTHKNHVIQKTRRNRIKARD